MTTKREVARAKKFLERSVFTMGMNENVPMATEVDVPHYPQGQSLDRSNHIFAHCRLSTNSLIVGGENSIVKHYDLRYEKCSQFEDPFIGAHGITSLNYNQASTALLASGFDGFSVYELDAAQKSASLSSHGLECCADENIFFMPPSKSYNCVATFLNDETALVTDSAGLVRTCPLKRSQQEEEGKKVSRMLLCLL